MRTRPRPPMRVRTGPALVAAALASMLVAGCSGSNDAGSSASTSTSSSASPTGTTSGTPSQTPSQTTSGSSEASDDPGASTAEGSLASKTFTVTTTFAQLPATIRFDVVSLQRRDDLLQLVARLTNTASDRSKDLRWQVSSRFDPGVNREDLQAVNGTFGGVVLTDVAEKKRYLVAADSSKDCVCTTNLFNTFLGAGQSVDLVATYAAPPTSTTKLDAEVPTLGLFRDLPIS